MSGYRGMSGEEFLDFILDERGLASFVDEQGDLSTLDEPWLEIATRVHGLSGKAWRPNPAQVEALYHSQKEQGQRDAGDTSITEQAA